MKRAERTVFSGDRLLADAQANGREAIRRQNAAIFDGGVLIDAEPGATAGSGLAFASGTARAIAHGLGRKAKGWMELYLPDVPSAGHVGLRSSAFPAGLSSATHVAVTPSATGVCCLFVY